MPRHEKIRAWTKKENDILTENYKYGAEYCASILNRSVSSITGQAHKLRITKDRPKFWTKAEINYMIEKYEEFGPDQIFLPGRSRRAIISKARLLGLKYMKNRPTHISNPYGWTEEEINILRMYYPKYGPKYCSDLLKDRTEMACSVKANNLRLKYEERPVYPGDRYTKEEDDKIMSMYLDGESIANIAKVMDGRSIFAIEARVSLLLKRNRKGRAYTKEETEFIINSVFTLGYAECAKHINRTRNSVYARVQYLINNGILPSDSLEVINKNTCKYKHWSKEETQYIIDNYAKNGAKACAEYLGKDINAIYGKARALNL